MKFGVPWSVKGIRPEARESAREAARRSGMSLGEWLNATILEQAAEDSLRAPGHEDDDEDVYADELAGVHERLDDLTRRISQYSRSAPKPAPRRRGRSPEPRAEQPDHLAELIGRLDKRIEQLVVVSSRPPMQPPMAVMHPAPQMPMTQPPPQPVPQMPQHFAPPMAPYAPHPAVAAYAPPTQRPQAFAPQPMPRPQTPAGLDRALAEIAARQRILNGQPPLPPVLQPAATQAPEAAPMPAMPQVPAQDLSGLEDQLRRITDQIETLRKPGVEEAINALRDELGDIGRALSDAMPRRAIDTIEKQIQGLTQRIAEGRQTGADQHALTGLEHGLAEVRDALRGLTPAENLVGFNDAVSGLAHKIDLIVAQKDPATLQQLEHAITTLREMATHVASNDAIGELAAQVHLLGQKVEDMGHSGGAGDALNHLEERIEALSHALAERAQNGSSVPPRLEALVQSLTDKIEQIQESRGDNPAIGHLEDRIVNLVERLDASDSRLGHLEAIERGLGDLLVQIDDMRNSKHADALRAEAESAVGVDSLKVDLARTQNALENVNGTLSAVVDRLARIESDIRVEGRRRAAEDEPLELTEPMGRVTARAVPDMAPAPQHLPPVAPMQMPAPERHAAPPLQPAQQVQQAQPVQPPQAPQPRPKHAPIDPDLPPDQPLEPGSGPPRQRVGARIAIGDLRPAQAPVGAAASGPSNFIAAARRAAQGAVQTGGRSARPQDAQEAATAEAPGGLMKRMKSLFVAASIVAIAVGVVQVGGKFLFGDRPVQSAKIDGKAAMLAPAQQPPAADDDEDGDQPAATPASPLAAAVPTVSAPSSILTSPTPMIPALSSPLAAPALTATPSKSDVTGSIPPSALRAPAGAAERLPTEIGGPKLRNAALGGNAAAAYEIGVRYAEGHGVQANPEEAARWYERAASRGVALAQFRYASMLEKGHGVKKDLGQARRLYLAAATKGNAKAMHNLAVLYAEGIDGKPDYATAAQWFRKAADHGVADSQYNLGVLAARGLGTPKSLTDSYKWFALAAAQGDKEAARKRDEIATQMDADALTAAQASAKTFVAAAQPQDAITVATPPGGWDDAATPAAPSPAARGKPVSGTPLALGSYKVGNR